VISVADFLNMCPATVLAVQQTTMAQMSSQSDTNQLLAATVHGKGLKPSQPSSTPSSGQPPTIPDQRMAMSSGPPGYFFHCQFCYITVMIILLILKLFKNNNHIINYFGVCLMSLIGCCVLTELLLVCSAVKFWSSKIIVQNVYNN